MSLQEAAEEQTHRGCHAKRAAEIGVTLPRVRERREPPRLEEVGGRLLQSPQKEHSPADTSIWDVWPPERIENKFLSFCPVGDSLFQQPQDTNIHTHSAPNQPCLSRMWLRQHQMWKSGLELWIYPHFYLTSTLPKCHLLGGFPSQLHKKKKKRWSLINPPISLLLSFSRYLIAASMMYLFVYWMLYLCLI